MIRLDALSKLRPQHKEQVVTIKEKELVENPIESPLDENDFSQPVVQEISMHGIKTLGVSFQSKIENYQENQLFEEPLESQH